MSDGTRPASLETGAGADDHSPTLCLVRHARAGSRERWAGDDRDRPLTAKGQKQAQLLAEHIVGRVGRPSRLLSSAAARCRETLAPLAEQCDLDIVETDWLYEGSSPEEAFDRLRTLTLQLDDASGAGGPVAASTHGDVVWGILDLLAQAGIDLGETAEAPKGALWILGFRSKAPASASFFVPKLGS
jgi:broad specificity phosphatase PhoE